jgi:hypothetical protein
MFTVPTGIKPMMKIVAAAALAGMIALPASAQTVKKKQQQVSSSSWVTAEQRARATGYSPSGNPEWDVYVRGEYVGSDPDPRVRWTLRDEAKRSYGFDR